MAIRRKESPALALLRTLFNVGAIGAMTDGQLLERFASGGEAAELAFAALIERHGPVVLHTCRSILRDEHEAEDAFQATFLVLVRKARSLWVRDSLGPWLHQVAYRAARCSRSAMARRTAHERVTADVIATRRRDATVDSNGLEAALHEEIERLPERYRAAIVLCDLEGRSHEQAARHMGCPVGTVKSRLARGRERLKDRLSRRGLAFGTMAWRGLTRPIPLERVASTASAAGHFLSIQAVPQGAAALLALGVLKSMAATRWWKLASILLAVCATTSGIVAIAGRHATVAEGRPEDTPKTVHPEGIAVTEVKPGKLRVVVAERGVLHAVRNSDVVCRVEPGTTIVSILPEGTPVTKGELVCELDSSSLKYHLANQVVAVKRAESALETARLARETAEIAVQEYVEGVYPKDLQAVSNEIVLARSSITIAEERLKRTRTASDQLNAVLAGQGGTKTAADVLAALDVEDRLAVAEERLADRRRALEIVQAKRDLLEKFTRDRMIKQLRIEADKQRPAERTQQAVCDLERAKEAKLRSQVDHCRLVAPSDGVVVYADDPGRREMGLPSRPQIEVGATVSERQKIFSVPDVAGPMRVAAKAHEAMVDQIAPGMAVQVTVDAFPDKALPGVVEAVAPWPDAASAGRNLKLYDTNVAITRGMSGLRPGMTAAVEILIAELDNVLSVPVQAVIQYDNTDHVAVKTPQGAVEWREVTLGRTNGQVVEVKRGIKAGEAIAVEPGPLLTEEQKSRMSLPPRKR